MADPNYGQWIKTESEGDAQSYTFTTAVGQNSLMGHRPPSSSSDMTSSSLRGAMGDIHISSASHYSGSPSPTSDVSAHVQSQQRGPTYDVASGMVWIHPSPDVPPQATMQSSGFGGASDQSTPVSFSNIPPPSVHPDNATNNYLQYSSYNSGTYPPQPSGSQHSQSVSSMFASSPYQDQFGFEQVRPSQSMAHGQITPHSATFPTQGRIASSSPNRPAHALDEENRHLRNRINQLELYNESARIRIRELEAELANPMHSASFAGPSSVSGLPTPLPTSPMSTTFNASWKARYDARVKLLCSLNRAGNALCAWHDTRRERRAHPPRMAPPGRLNCGCSFDEALFEESLARHGVGSYHPGESVRMDPALRNPLLKLLQQRFGYKDGDFERDPVTGNWVEGEGHTIWEAKVHSGGSSHRKARPDERH